MHVIVKKGVETKLRELIKSLQSDLTYIESQDVEKVTKEDLDYFYEMREIVNRRIEPAVKDMQNANSPSSLVDHEMKIQSPAAALVNYISESTGEEKERLQTKGH